MVIYYLCPDNSKPSWGVGIIYHHVAILRTLGFEAYVLHNQPGFSIDWLHLEVPINYFSDIHFSDKDMLVVPEVMAADYDYSTIGAKKIVFVQGLSLLFHNFKTGLSHKAQGFSEAFIILPHMKNPVEKYTGLPTRLIPPFIADYFFSSEKRLHAREKIVLFYPKYQQFEYFLIKHLICRDGGLQPNTFANRLLKQNWRFIELSGFSHQEVADLMKKAMFFISTNTFEGFNTSVPEAMAAGCINLCYEAFGPRDFLINNENAFVFPNNEALTLSEKAIDLIKNYPTNKSYIEEIRTSAWQTAQQYGREKMVEALKAYYDKLH